MLSTYLKLKRWSIYYFCVAWDWKLNSEAKNNADAITDVPISNMSPMPKPSHLQLMWKV